MKLETKLCPLNAGQPNQHAASQRWKRPLKVVGHVRPLADFEWTVYSDVVVSGELETALQDAGFSGVELCRAEAFTTTETPMGREVFELRVFGWGGGVAPRDSGVRILEECPVCGNQIFT
jgi:hypothetical protein